MDIIDDRVIAIMNKAADEIERLRAEVQTKSDMLAASLRIQQSLERDIAELQADADRYRWLRDTAAYVGVNPHAKTCLWTLRGVYEIQGQGFDTAIDAAMKEQK